MHIRVWCIRHLWFPCCRQITYKSSLQQKYERKFNTFPLMGGEGGSMWYHVFNPTTKLEHFFYCRVRLKRKAKKSNIIVSSNLGSNVLSDIDDWDNRTWITGASLYNVDKHPISKSLESIGSMPPDYITATTIPGWGDYKDFATLMINANDHSSTSYYDKVYSNQPGYKLTNHPAKYQRPEHFPVRTSSEPRPDYMDQYLHRPKLYPNSEDDNIISIPLSDYPR